MKTGIFGGSFNPVHRGHVQLAATIRAAFSLDTIMVIPSAEPPHKDTENLAAPADRLEMARLAFATAPDCEVSDVEVKRGGPSYTIETIRFFLCQFPEDRLYLILGLDAFLELDTWKDYRKLLQTLPLIVVNRKHAGQNEEEAFRNFLTGTLSRKYVFSEKTGGHHHPDLQPVFFYPAFTAPFSATEIRRRIKSFGRPPEGALPPAVAQYIQKRNLYQCPPTSNPK